MMVIEPGPLPVIGVPFRPWNRAGKPPRLMQDRSYVDVVVAAGGVPLPLPIIPVPHLRQLFTACDGLLLPGGRDVEPAAYGGQHPPGLTLDTHPELDAIEIQLVRWAAEDRVPVLGICRGAQLLNVALGGDLWVDLESAGQCAPFAHQAAPGTAPAGMAGHPVTITTLSWLHTAVGALSVPVNSRHHQAVRSLGRQVTAVAHAPDGVVEAIEVDDAQWFAGGVQWHPEELPPDHPAGPVVVSALVSAAARQRMNRMSDATMGMMSA